MQMNKEDIGRAGGVLNQHEKRLIRMASNKQYQSCRKLSKELKRRRGDGQHTPSRMTVHRYRQSVEMKPFHVLKKPYKTLEQTENRLWFSEYLENWDENDFHHVVCSDEFFAWVCRKPNSQNDRIWATSIQEIEDNEHYREMVVRPSCIGIFICFSIKKMMWVIKEDGETWNGEYFREVILEQNVLPFLKDPENVEDVDQVTFLHDKAPCFKAMRTQEMLRNSGIDFFDNTVWPGSSPDLNPCENIGAILKEKVDAFLHQNPNRLKKEMVRTAETNILNDMKNDQQLFENLLNSFPSRLRAVKASHGGHTDY